jgi:uncharacterized coiled-coil protein SlyX
LPRAREGAIIDKMTEDTENLVLEHLRHLRGAAGRIEERLGDLTLRMGHVEEGVARIHVQLAEHSIRLDRVGDRLDRIEKRLELRESLQ